MIHTVVFNRLKRELERSNQGVSGGDYVPFAHESPFRSGKSGAQKTLGSYTGSGRVQFAQESPKVLSAQELFKLGT